MKILVVGDDDALRSLLAKELEARDYEVVQTHFGDGGLRLYEKSGPWEIGLADYRFIPGVKIKDCIQLVTAIHLNSPFQPMAIMTADPKDTPEKLPQALLPPHM